MIRLDSGLMRSCGIHVRDEARLAHSFFKGATVIDSIPCDCVKEGLCKEARCGVEHHCPPANNGWDARGNCGAAKLF